VSEAEILEDKGSSDFFVLSLFLLKEGERVKKGINSKK